jgi:hypothetical protein
MRAKLTTIFCRPTGMPGGRLVALILCIAGLWGCGIKAPPVPPQQRQAPPVVDLYHELDGPVFSMTWRLADVDPSRFDEAEGCRVYRARTRLADSNCPGCPPDFEPVADIPVGDGDAAGTPIQYVETLDAGVGYTYKVVCYTENGIDGTDSDWVTVSY